MDDESMSDYYDDSPDDEDTFHRASTDGNIEFGSKNADDVFWYPSCKTTDLDYNLGVVDKRLESHQSIYNLLNEEEKLGYCANIQVTTCVEDLESKMVLMDIPKDELKPLESNHINQVYMDGWIGTVVAAEYALELTALDGRTYKLKYNSLNVTNFSHPGMTEKSFDPLMSTRVLYSLLGNVRCEMFDDFECIYDDKWWILTQLKIKKLNVERLEVKWMNCVHKQFANAVPPSEIFVEDMDRVKFFLSIHSVAVAECYYYDVKGDENMIVWDTFQNIQKKKYHVENFCDTFEEKKEPLWLVKPIPKGTRLVVRILTKETKADFIGQDGVIKYGVPATQFCCVEDFVAQKVVPGIFVRSDHDHPFVYGVVKVVDKINKIVKVKRYHICSTDNNTRPIYVDSKVLGLYDVKIIKKFDFYPGSFVKQTKFLDSPRNGYYNIGTVLETPFGDKVKVRWIDGRITMCWPVELKIIRLKYFNCFDDVSTSETTTNNSSINYNTTTTTVTTTTTNESQTTESTLTSNSQTSETPVSGTSSSLAESMETDVSESQRNYSKPRTIKVLKEYRHMIKCNDACLENIKKFEIMMQNKIMEESLNEQLTSCQPSLPKKRKLSISALKSQDELIVPPMSIAQENSGHFEIQESVPSTHEFHGTQFNLRNFNNFANIIKREHDVLNTMLPPGIWVKTFEDRLDLFSFMIRGVPNTPYEDGLFFFDVQLPSTYPNVPPNVHNIPFIKNQVNPNLYPSGKVCVSLLNTWPAKHQSESWISTSSNLLQVAVSIQSLILNAEPMFNEPDDADKQGTPSGNQKSIEYNEKALKATIQGLVNVMNKPPTVFKKEVVEHFKTRGENIIVRLEYWKTISKMYFEYVIGNNTVEKSFKEFANERNYVVPDFLLLPVSKKFCNSSTAEDFKYALETFLKDEEENADK